MTRHRLSPDLSAATARRGSSGFTLIELITVIVLIGILGAVGTSMLVDTYSTARRVDADNTSAAQARYALERLAREIREVKYDSGNYAISTMTAALMVFTKTISGTDVTVTINYSNPNLTLQYSSPAVTATLSNHASGFSLTYLDANNCPTTTTTGNVVGTVDCVTPGTISFILINLTMTDPESGQPIAQRTRVALRNQ